MSDGKTVDLAAIRARVAAAATPGPWRAGSVEAEGKVWVPYSGALEGPSGERCLLNMNTAFPHTADRTLIAHAPADIAALCDEIARLRSELDDARNVALGLTEDCAGLREIIAGRDRAPTPEEVDAHAKHGRWRGVLPGGRIFTARFPGETERHWRDTRWWAIDETETPCAWPVVTPARAKPCECSAAHADEYVAVCDKSCDCLCHE